MSAAANFFPRMNAELQVFDFVDDRHPSLAKRTNDAVIADDLARQKVHIAYRLLGSSSRR